MRRVSIVSCIAALVVAGHLAYHLVPRPWAEAPVAAVSLPPSPGVSGPPPPAVGPPPLVVSTCRLQPPLREEADREPMLAALRQLIAREVLSYPHLAGDGDGRNVLRRLETCGGWLALGLAAGDIRLRRQSRYPGRRAAHRAGGGDRGDSGLPSPRGPAAVGKAAARLPHAAADHGG